MNHNRLIAKEIAAIVPALEQETILNLLEKPKKSSMGDLAFPTFSLAKTMRKAPQIIASELVGQINNSYFEKVEAVGPYINFFLNKSEISAQVLKEVIKKREDYAQAAIGQGHNIVIDLSSPNIAKPFSIGHLRSTVIGNALSNIFQKLGYETVKINHLGDWGKQFGMLIVAYKKWGSEEAVRAHPIDELLKIY